MYSTRSAKHKKQKHGPLSLVYTSYKYNGSIHNQNWRVRITGLVFSFQILEFCAKTSKCLMHISWFSLSTILYQNELNVHKMKGHLWTICCMKIPNKALRYDLAGFLASYVTALWWIWPLQKIWASSVSICKNVKKCSSNKAVHPNSFNGSIRHKASRRLVNWTF